MGYTWRLQLGAFDLLMADLNSVAFRAPATAYTKSQVKREVPVTLPEKARAAYAEMEKTMQVELGKLDLGTDVDPVVAMSEAAASQKLRQIVQGYLYEVDDKGRRIVHELHDEKVQALAELIESMGREPLLVCYQFDQDLENIRRIWKNVPYLGQGVSSAQASENIDRWNKRELPVMAIHPNSASHGLNLQYGGHHIAWLALPWSLDGYKQSVERLDRRGQTAQVYSHHIIAHNTIDEKVSAALIEKDEAQNRLIAAIRKL
jgi:SNF2 family DNA or RNA helicase